MKTLPEIGFVRLKQIVGDPKKGTPPIIPLCSSKIWEMVKAGTFPQPIRLGPKCTAWRVEDVRRFIENGGV